MDDLLNQRHFNRMQEHYANHNDSHFRVHLDGVQHVDNSLLKMWLVVPVCVITMAVIIEYNDLTDIRIILRTLCNDVQK